MNVQPCARCGYGVYPAEKINCIDQTWHKACFHCEVCKMMLTVNNFVSHEKKPYCQAHNPKNNAFMSVFETPINMNAKKLSEVVSEIKYREEREQLKSVFQWDARSREIENVYKAQQLATQNAYYASYEEGKSWYPGTIPDPEMVKITQAQKALADFQYTEDYEPRRGKGSFPAMITPGYQVAKRANQLSSNVEYKRGHEERVSKFTSVVDTPDILHAKAGAHLASDLKYTEDFEERKGKGSFPAMITPAYQIAKRANELASDVKYHQRYEKEIKGKASHTAGTDVASARENADQYEQGYMDEFEERRGKGSFPAMITPAYQNAKKANELASDIKYKKDLSKMKGAAHFHSLTAEDNLVLKQAQSVNKLVSEVEYKKDLGNNKGYSMNYCDTPQFKNVSKISKFTSDLKYKETYQNEMKGHYMGIGMDKRMLHAMKVGSLASNLNYRAEYEKTKTNYTLPQDVPLLVKAKANAELYSEIKYKEGWEKSKGRGFEMKLDSLPLLAAKASRDLASDIKYKEEYEKTKGKATETKDSRLLHSLKVAKMSSEIAYKKGFEESKAHFHLPMDMINLRHAKKAQALASDLDYRTRLHEYTVLPEDMKTKWAKKAYDLQSDTKYRQKADALKFTSVADSSQIKHAKKSQELQSDVAYRSGKEQFLHQYAISKDEPVFMLAKANAANISEKLYRSSWEKQKEKGFVLRLDALSFLTAKAKRDLASDVKYKEGYEKMKGKLIGVKAVEEDSQMAHSLQMSKLQSELEYKKAFEGTKSQFQIPMDMVNLVHAKKAQNLATDIGYKTSLHQYTALPTDRKVAWAKWAYGLQSDNRYRADLNWMKGAGWIATGSLNVEQAKKAGELISEKKYRQHPYALKFTSIKDTPEMIQARISYNQAVDRLYKEHGESIKHQYTPTTDLPEILQAKLNAMNISETHYKESWRRMKDGGYQLKLDAIPFQAAKASGEIISDHKYKEAFQKMKGQMVGSCGLDGDIRMAHSVHATSLQSDVKYKQGFEDTKSQFHLPLDMIHLVHARKAQSLVSEQEYRQLLHQYTALTDDVRLQCAKNAYKLQSENLYRSDMNFMRGVGCITPGALEIEGKKKASELISESKYRQQPHSFKYTSVTDSPGLLHAKFSNMIANEAKYRESWHNLRAQGYKLTMEALPFQTARASREIASDYQYKHNFVMERGKCIGARSVLDDARLLHCLHAAKLQSEQEYKKGSQDVWSQFHLPMDMVNLVHARKAQALASDQDYRQRLHEFTALPEDMKMKWAKRAHMLQSEHRYKSDLNFMKGVGWMALRSPQIESVKKAGELISETKYRQKPESLKFTAVVDSPSLIHAKNSYLQCNDRLYKAGGSEDRHRYTLLPDHPDFIRARQNALYISDKLYKTSWEQTRASGYDFRIDAIPFQTAKASREIASDYKYREAFLRDRGQQIGFLSANDDPKIRHVLRVGKLQSDLQYRNDYALNMAQYRSHLNQPGFLHAKRSQQLASNVNYRQPLHQYTCDPEQLNVKHAKQAYKLQSDVEYKSDLNWLRGIGWTPPGSHKVEMARRAAELAYLREMGLLRASAQYRPGADQLETEGSQQVGVNPDASEILQGKRRQMQFYQK
ncbi:Nebulin-related-anchoring protein [Turdus rufiventris]|nr:Nebulin-related-anchoring protein [Turdus rufiventris]